MLLKDFNPIGHEPIPWWVEKDEDENNNDEGEEEEE